MLGISGKLSDRTRVLSTEKKKKKRNWQALSNDLTYCLQVLSSDLRTTKHPEGMSNPGPAAPTAATAAPKTKPDNYIMGTYQASQLGKGDWHIIAGHKPKADWSGIDYTEPVPTYIPTQKRRFRSMYETTE